MKLILTNGRVIEAKDHDSVVAKYVSSHIIRGLEPTRIKAIKNDEGDDYSEEEIEDVFEECCNILAKQDEEDSDDEAEGLRLAKEEAAYLLGVRV